MPRIALDRADTEPLEFDERISIPADSLGEDVVSAAAVHLTGAVTKSEPGYHLAGTVDGGGELRCVRCLEPFSFTFEEAVEVDFLPVTAAPSEDEHQLERDDLEVVFYEEPVIELQEVAAEQFQLAVPMKPLCRDECRGLCGRCGANLNTGDCSCPAEPDERWQPLAQWRPSN